MNHPGLPNKTKNEPRSSVVVEVVCRFRVFAVSDLQNHTRDGLRHSSSLKRNKLSENGGHQKESASSTSKWLQYLAGSDTNELVLLKLLQAEAGSRHGQQRLALDLLSRPKRTKQPTSKISVLVPGAHAAAQTSLRALSSTDIGFVSGLSDSECSSSDSRSRDEPAAQRAG
jgi:hypothetical protein